MDYGQILQRAWYIVWNNKWLWALGFLAALGSGGSGGGGGNSGFQFGSNEEIERFVQDPMFGDRLSENLTRNIELIFGTLIGLFCLLLIVGLVLWVIGLAARAGLIRAVVDLDRKQPITLGEAFRDGISHTLPALGMTLLLALPVIVVVALMIGIGVVVAGVGVSSIAAGGSERELLGAMGTVLACLLPLACLLFFYGIGAQFINALAYRGIVLHDLGAVASIRHGWNVLRGNLVEFFLLGLAFAVIGFLYGLLVTVIVGLVFVVGAGPALFGLLINDEPMTAAKLTSFVLTGLLSVLLMGLLNAILVAWRSAAFTLAYNAVTGGGDDPNGGDGPPKPADWGADDNDGGAYIATG